MGCCASSPHSVRRYRDPADFDEDIVSDDVLPLRTFGEFRNGGVVIPDDIDGLPSTWIDGRLPSNPNEVLYTAEQDHGRAFRCARPVLLCFLTPWGLTYLASKGLSKLLHSCTCDEICCHLRKEYSTRTHYQVYPNRIEVNYPHMRIPFGFLGCGSWSADSSIAHAFDRGAFGFRRVQCGVINYLCCTWPVYGGAVARQRCPCNGPLWSGGWWCDEWCVSGGASHFRAGQCSCCCVAMNHLRDYRVTEMYDSLRLCDMAFCSFRYYGLANADEVSMASNIALQAYFEGRRITKEDMDKCLVYWRSHVAESTDPIGRKRNVMCEPFCVPWYDCSHLYKCFHLRRQIPYKKDDDRTVEIQEVYNTYEEECKEQIKNYTEFYGPVRNGTVCRTMGCRRIFGRRGLVFCTEGCCDGPKIRRNKGDPFPPMAYPDYEDDNDAARIMLKVLGDPPPNVLYKRWEKHPVTGEFEVVTIQAKGDKYKAVLSAREGLEVPQSMTGSSIINPTLEDGIETAL